MLIANYKLSGGGDGQCSLIDNEENIDGCDRLNFLKSVNGAKPHHLYMWEIFDRHDILDHTLSKISDECKASSSSYVRPEVYGKKRKQFSNDFEEQRALAIKQYVKTCENSAHNEKVRAGYDYAKLAQEQMKVMHQAELEWAREKDESPLKSILHKHFKEAKDAYEHTYNMYKAMKDD